jgi:hypothetical protein
VRQKQFVSTRLSDASSNMKRGTGATEAICVDKAF